MKMFTEEWVKAFAEKLKNDQEFQEKGKGFDSNLQFIILKDPKAGVNKDTGFGMWMPTIDNFWYGIKDQNEVDIILQAKASVVQDVFKGKKNVVMALTMGSIKLKKGPLTKLTGNLGAVNRFIEVAKSIS